MGVKVTIMAQLPPDAATVAGLAGQLFVSVKSVVPMMEMEVMVSGDVELFSRVTV